LRQWSDTKTNLQVQDLTDIDLGQIPRPLIL